jgi:hypothetical protein
MAAFDESQVANCIYRLGFEQIYQQGVTDICLDEIQALDGFLGRLGIQADDTKLAG